MAWQGWSKFLSQQAVDQLLHLCWAGATVAFPAPFARWAPLWVGFVAIAISATSVFFLVAREFKQWPSSQRLPWAWARNVPIDPLLDWVSYCLGAGLGVGVWVLLF